MGTCMSGSGDKPAKYRMYIGCGSGEIHTYEIDGTSGAASLVRP